MFNEKALAFQLQAQQGGVEPPPLIDLTADPDEIIRQGGPKARPERLVVTEVRALVQACAEDGDTAALATKLENTTVRIETAIKSCQELARQKDEKEPYHIASIHAYQEVLENLDLMLDAIDGRNFDSLLQAFTGFEAAVAEVDALVQEVEEEFAEEGVDPSD